MGMKFIHTPMGSHAIDENDLIFDIDSAPHEPGSWARPMPEDEFAATALAWCVVAVVAIAVVSVGAWLVGV